jgi:hypothetical protein
MLKHNVLYAFIIKQLKHTVDMGDAWVRSYEALATGAKAKMKSLDADSTLTQVI